ncbi:MAG: universal stress protein [Acidobacteria bacterium]|nr:universal stress protein [Acidobacteriota bacterium]
MSKQVLIATDFSDISANAQLYGAWLSESIGAQIHVVHVFDPDALQVPAPYYFMPAVDDWIKEHTDKARGRAHELLSEIAGTLGPDCVSHFREGKPQEEIVACAEEIKADMIVMGSHGYRGLSRMVLGSVTEYVLRHSECPVVAVKHKKAE